MEKSRNKGKKKKKLLHPKSRKAKYLVRRITHQERQEEVRGFLLRRRKEWTTTVQWFYDYTKLHHKGQSCLSMEQIRLACNKFATRFDADINALQRDRNKSNMLIEAYRKQLLSTLCSEGMEVPDLRSRFGMKWLCAWDRTASQALRIPRIKIRSTIISSPGCKAKEESGHETTLLNETLCSESSDDGLEKKSENHETLHQRNESRRVDLQSLSKFNKTDIVNAATIEEKIRKYYLKKNRIFHERERKKNRTLCGRGGPDGETVFDETENEDFVLST